jgi:hypothetical protein
MKKASLIGIVFIWLACLSVLIVTFLDIYPNNPLSSYRYIVGIGFIAISGLLKFAYARIANA